MTDSIDTIIDGVLEREGGSAYTDAPADKGGPTRWGVTQGSLEDWRGHPVTAKDVEALTEDEARRIYRKKYVERPGFALVTNLLLREILVDMEVNHRPGVAVKLLQRALGIKEDGILGPVTAAAVNRSDQNAVFRDVAAFRVEHYMKILHDDPTQAKWANGWGSRAAGFVRRIPVAA